MDINVLDKLNDDISDLIDKCARKLRDKYVIPMCKKYDLSFDAGMGAFSFSDKNGDCIYKNMETEEIYGNDLWDAIETLEMGSNFVPFSIGSCIESYNIRE